MKEEEVKKLLESFYNGYTTIEEEEILMHFFATEDVPEELLPDKEFFIQLIHKEKDENIPVGFENKLDNLIDEWSEKDVIKYNIGKKKSNRTSWIWFGGIAASLLLLFSIWTFTDDEQSYRSSRVDTYSNPEDAYKETEKVLLLIAENLNKSLEQVETVQNEMENVDNILIKQFDLIKKSENQ